MLGDDFGAIVLSERQRVRLFARGLHGQEACPVEVEILRADGPKLEAFLRRICSRIEDVWIADLGDSKGAEGG